MKDIKSILPKGSYRAPNGWYNFNAPCCTHRGESQDKRKRGGILFENDGFVYHCFNCKFKTKFVMGEALGKGASNLLSWMGVDDDTISELSLHSIKHRSFNDIIEKEQLISNNEKYNNIHFKEYELPSGSRPITSSDTKYVEYLASRGLTINDYNFKITPRLPGKMNKRIIIPYMNDGKVVGWTSRFMTVGKMRYLNEHQQEGYLFGIDFIKKDWKYAIVAEGVLDAVSIKCMAVMHGEFTDKQLVVLHHLDKEVIVVPDQDKPGLILAEQAIKEGFAISVPDWGKNKVGVRITDINEALQEYGRIATLASIMCAKESNNIKSIMALRRMKEINGI